MHRRREILARVPFLLLLAAMSPAQATLTRSNPSPVLSGPIAWEPNTGEAYWITPGSAALWRFDDGIWVATTSTNAAPQLAAPTVCTWANHGVLMVGSGQTWSFDGASWTHVAAGPAATVRTLAYDPLRSVVVAVANGTPAAVQTWEFDGGAWTQRTPVSAPPTLTSLHMAWEPSSQRCLLRISNGTTVAGHFTWNGTGWTDHGFVGMEAQSFGMATAPNQGGVLIAGGFTFPLYAGFTLLWRPTGPVGLPAGGPRLRRHCVAWFDATRNHTVVTNVAAGDRETWYWNGTAWSRATRGRQLPEAMGPIAYDSWRGRVLAFGG